MRIVKVTAMICSFMMVSMCGDGDKETEGLSAEDTGVFLMEDLVIRNLEIKNVELDRRIRDTEDPKEIEELQEQVDVNNKEINMLEEVIKSFGVDEVFLRIPPLPPLPGPCGSGNCPMAFGNLEVIIFLRDIEINTIALTDAESQKPIGSFESTEIEGFQGVSFMGKEGFEGNAFLQANFKGDGFEENLNLSVTF